MGGENGQACQKLSNVSASVLILFQSSYPGLRSYPFILQWICNVFQIGKIIFPFLSLKIFPLSQYFFLGVNV